MGIFVILIGDFDETEIKILLTAGSLAGLSILGLPSLFHIERNKSIKDYEFYDIYDGNSDLRFTIFAVDLGTQFPF